MSMKDLCEIIEVQQRRLHNARKERLHKFGLSPIGESRWKAGRDALLPTALFVPPGASVLPEVPHPGNSGAPVRILSREDIARLDPDLQAYLVNAGQFGARNGDENERCADVVLSVLEGPGGVQYDDSEGELAQHGHWYQYLSNESWPDSATGLSARAYPARRPKRAKNIKALYVTGNTIDMDFDSLVSCLVTLPPKMVQSKDILKGPMDEDDTRTAAVSAIEVLARGPCHGPYTLLLHNAIVDKHALEKVAQALMSNPLSQGMCTLDSVIFFNNSLNSLAPKTLDILLNSFKKNYRLVLIRISLNNIANPAASCIFSAVSGCVALQSLNLNNNTIGDAGLKTVGNLLANTRHLLTLDLGYNRISDEGMLHICRGLVRNQTLTELSLSGNRLRNLSMHYLEAALSENDKNILIKKLDVDPSTHHHLNSWTPNQSLRTLRFSWNYLADAAAENIAMILWRHLAATYIDLSFNNIGEPGARALAHGVVQRMDTGSDCGKLHVVLNRNRFGAAGKNAIDQAIKTTGNVHIFKMEGVRPGFGVSVDVDGPKLEEGSVFEILKIESRPSTNVALNRSQRMSKKVESSGISTPPVVRPNTRSSKFSARFNLEFEKVLQKTPPASAKSSYLSGSQTDRPQASETLLPEIARPRTVRFVDDSSKPSSGMRRLTTKSFRQGSREVGPATRQSVDRTKATRLRTAERALVRKSSRLGSHNSQRSAPEDALGGEHECSFVAACHRLNLPAKFDKPPRTSGTRRKQEKIYQAYLASLSKRPSISTRLPHIIQNLVQHAGMPNYSLNWKQHSSSRPAPSSSTLNES